MTQFKNHKATKSPNLLVGLDNPDDGGVINIGDQKIIQTVDFFTPIFVIARITGWTAHIMEQHAANKLIRPLAKYKGEKHRKVILLNQR